MSTLADNGRRPQIFLQMEDDLKYFRKWKMTSIFVVNGRQPQIFLKMEDDLKYLFNGR